MAGEQVRRGAARSPLAELARVRLQGNHLRELDRLLSLLIDAVAAVGHVRPADAHRHIAGLRNTPRKLHLVAPVAAGEARRLRAIGRISACLHHCGGVIHQPSLHRDVRIAQGDAGLIPIPANDDDYSARLLLSSRAMGAISGLYRKIGDRLVARIAAPDSDVDFYDSAPYINQATVAGDEI